MTERTGKIEEYMGGYDVRPAQKGWGVFQGEECISDGLDTRCTALDEALRLTRIAQFSKLAAPASSLPEIPGTEHEAMMRRLNRGPQINVDQPVEQDFGKLVDDVVKAVGTVRLGGSIIAARSALMSAFETLKLERDEAKTDNWLLAEGKAKTLADYSTQSARVASLERQLAAANREVDAFKLDIATLQEHALIHRNVVGTDITLPIHFTAYIEALEAQLMRQNARLASQEPAIEAARKLDEAISLQQTNGMGGLILSGRVIDTRKKLVAALAILAATPSTGDTE